MMPHDIDHWFDHHPPSNPDVVRAHEMMREIAKTHAKVIDLVLPDGPEKTLALRGLKDVLARANESIALNQTPLTQQDTVRIADALSSAAFRAVSPHAQ